MLAYVINLKFTLIYSTLMNSTLKYLNSFRIPREKTTRI